jgi:drug/metabolite transporter (DMT)-like permease|tara:strand:+ start:2357 stop:3235 length:879 start_codon:yes stop_codon:yes gene_type:complete
MEWWVGLTVAGAFLQNLRSLLQRRLTRTLSVNGSSYVRFLYALPFAWLLVLWLGQTNLPVLTPSFWWYVCAGGITQIVATSALVAAVSNGEFAVGTAMSKTEAMQAAAIGLILLGEQLSLQALLGIAVSLVGVFLLTGGVSPRQIFQRGPALWLGLLAGSSFALCSVCFRGASLALGTDETDAWQRAALTLAATLTLQAVVMGAYLIVREPRQLQRVVSSWRVAIWVGLIGMTSSICWFTAMALVNAALVRAMGQIELLFTLITSIWFLGERVRRREVLGMLLLVLGIVLLI